MRRLGLLFAAFACACAAAGRSTTDDRCAAQECGSDDQGCDAVVLDRVWIWDGRACVEAYASGCGRVGPDCGSLYETRGACEADWSECLGARASR